MLEFVFDDIFVIFGGRDVQQTVGIMQVLLECCYIQCMNGKFTMGKLESSLLS
jgi:hypothetical protein